MATKHIKQHVMIKDGDVVLCELCDERQYPNAPVNHRLKQSCTGAKPNSDGVMYNPTTSSKEKLYEKYPMLGSYKGKEHLAERARAALYGSGPYPEQWRLPCDDNGQSS